MKSIKTNDSEFHGDIPKMIKLIYVLTYTHTLTYSFM